jgi:serine/threonine-protein kinase SRPK3
MLQIALGGGYSRDYFNRHGELRHIRKLRYWPLDKVLVEKYGFTVQDGQELADFLHPLLDFIPDKRPTAAQCLSHPWLNTASAPVSLPVPLPLEVEKGLITSSVENNLENNVENYLEGVHANEAMERAEVAMGNIDIRGPEMLTAL